MILASLELALALKISNMWVWKRMVFLTGCPGGFVPPWMMSEWLSYYLLEGEGNADDWASGLVLTLDSSPLASSASLRRRLRCADGIEFDKNSIAFLCRPRLECLIYKKRRRPNNFCITLPAKICSVLEQRWDQGTEATCAWSRVRYCSSIFGNLFWVLLVNRQKARSIHLKFYIRFPAVSPSGQSWVRVPLDRARIIVCKPSRAV